MGLVDEGDEVLREVVDQRMRRGAGVAAVEDPRVVLDPRGEAGLPDHLEVVHRALAQPVGLEVLSFGLELGQPGIELGPDRLQRTLDRILLSDVMGSRPDRDVLNHVEHLAGQRIEVMDRLDLVAEQRNPEGGLGIGRHDLDHLALDSEPAARKGRIVALVLEPDQLAQHLVAVDRLPHLEQLHLIAVQARRTDAVDAGDRGDDDHIAAGQQGGCRRVAEPVDLIVDR